MTGALSGFLGGPPQPQGQGQNQGPNLSNTIDPNSILSGDFNPQDYLGADPTYQAEQVVPAGAATDPSTGSPSSPGTGQRVADAGTSGDLGSLRNLIMSAASQPQAGTPGIVRTPPGPGQPTAPGWFPAQSQGPMGNIVNMPASAVGGPSAYNAYQPMVPQARAQAPAPPPTPEPVPLPQPRPADAPASFDERFGNLPPATPAPDAPTQDPYMDPGGAFGLNPERLAGTGIYPPVAPGPQSGLPVPFTQNTGDLPIISPFGSDQTATAAVGPVQTSPLGHEPAADVPMESGVSGAARPNVTNVPVKPAPSQQEQPQTAPAPQQPQSQYTPEQYMQQFGPQLLRDFLQGGPRALIRDLESLAGQMARGGRSQDRSRFVPPQNFSGKIQPKSVRPTRETPAASPASLSSNARSSLDPITASTAGATPTPAPANAPAGAAPRADWGGNYNIANRAIPAPIRFNNPGGAQAWSGSAKWGGQGNYSLVRHPGTGEMDKISHYPTPVHGAASNLDQITSARNYRGRRLGDAMRTWSGNMRATTGDRALDNLPATRETFQNPEVAIKFLTAMQRSEAGRVWMTREQMLSAWQMWQAGSAQAYEANLGRAA